MPRRKQSDLPHWLVIGGIGIGAAVLYVAMRQSTLADHNATGLSYPRSSALSNVGTPFFNGALFGAIDPWSGSQSVNANYASMPLIPMLQELGQPLWPNNVPAAPAFTNPQYIG